MYRMDVTDVLRGRMHQPAGLQRMAAVSALVHGAALAALVLAPGNMFSSRPTETRSVMTISLGEGTPGPTNSGLTNIGGRPVQVEKPPEAPKEALRPPAAKAPEMTIPVKGAKPVPNSSTTVKEAPEEARGRTPTKGAEPTPGTSVADTGVRGQGFGLSTGGGAGSGSRLDISGDFCCPEYVILMVEKIRGNWNQTVDAVGEVFVAFTIQRDGRLTNVTTEQSSGYSVLDLNAQRAVVYTRQLPALPDAYPNESLTVHLNFQYKR
jgi:TonB family protein